MTPTTDNATPEVTHPEARRAGDLCSECRRQPRWLDPRRPGGWQWCVPCLRDLVAQLRERHAAALRCQPLDDGRRDPWQLTPTDGYR
jgi:hypothetical protein